MSGRDRGEPPKKRVHGRRKGRPLRPGRQALVETLLPRLRVPVPETGTLDAARLFDPPKDRLWLEIGFGAGEHLAAQAAAHPDAGLIGCEIFLNGIAALLREVDASGLGNVRIWDEDARLLIDALPDASLDRVFLLFPDPWPKARHAARRFVNPRNLDALARVLRDGGELRIASDHPVYQRWTLEQMHRRGDFAWLATTAADWREPPADWVETRYERKARREGRTPVYLIYRREKRGESAC